MLRCRAAAHASRAANAAYRSAGGPRAFSWLQCLGETDERGPDRLYLYVVTHREASAAALYHFATRSACEPVPYEHTQHCLQVACAAFVGVVRQLEPMVQIAAAAEQRARQIHCIAAKRPEAPSLVAPPQAATQRAERALPVLAGARLAREAQS